VVLTIDLELQKVAEKALGGANGAIVALNPKTGAILAMVSHPSFDPNQLVFDPNVSQWSEEENRIDTYWRSLNADLNAPLLNRATQGLYTPGSTFKTVTLAAALERGIAKPDTRYQFEMKPPDAQHPTAWHANQFTTCQNHAENNLDLVHAYAYSCNVVFSDLGLQIGQRVYQDYAKAFGLGSAPPIEIGATASQLFHTPNYFSGDERFYALASTAFGQGEIAATPLQMALVASGVAADGEIYAPYVVSEVRRKDGTVLERTTPHIWKRAMQPDTARLVRQIMVTSVDVGWASAAKVKGVKVAGKTGSAESGTSNKPHSWFIGFAPADDPVVAIAVLKEFAGYGSAEAAPVAKTIIEAAIQQQTP
jgi:peptidoglycan glycosyltransferase